MGSKVFISYKYSDNSVQQLKSRGNLSTTTARDYVDLIQEEFKRDNHHINKGEKDGEKLDDFKKETIRSKLADKIFDSSVTIVLISPKMKDSRKAEQDQWIPWEIAYSLRNKSRSAKKSKLNAILLVVLPDKSGSYNYASPNDVKPHPVYFDIIQKNLNNLLPKQHYKAYKLKPCCSKSYMLRCNWNKFIPNCSAWIDAALEIRDNKDKYDIDVKSFFK
jgi:hypothetical protein